MARRVLSIILAVLTLFTLCAPALASAEPGAVPAVPAENVLEPEATPEQEEPDDEPEETAISGQCGDNVWWSCVNGKLTIYGSGPMYDYYIDEIIAPWFGLAKTVEIKQGVTYIGEYNFSGNSVEEITIPSSVKTIGADAFYDCETLSRVTIKNGLTTIKSGAFSYCLNLTEISLPESVAKIGSNAFTDCARLKRITIRNPKCNIDADHDNPSYKTYTLGVRGTTTIAGHWGSTAQAYAKKYGFSFQPIDNGWVTVNGKKYYYVNGIMQTGSKTINGKTYYFSVLDGHMLTGLVNTGDGIRYFSTKNGYMLKGLVTVDSKGHQCYFSAKDGRRLTGLVNSGGGKTRYFSAKDGHMMKGGFVTVGSNKYYLSAKDGHVLKGGTVKVSGKLYYLSVKNGRVLTGGWITGTGGKRYYASSAGVLYTGTHTIGGKEYTFGSDGHLISQSSSVTPSTPRPVTPSPEPTPTPEPVYKTYYVGASEGAYYYPVCLKPQTNALVGWVPSGAKVKVRPDKASGNWYWIEYESTEGYIDSRYLSRSEPRVVTLCANYDAGGYVNIYFELGGNVIGHIPAGEQATIYVDFSNGNWYWVEYKGTFGYADGRYFTGSTSAPTPAPVTQAPVTPKPVTTYTYYVSGTGAGSYLAINSRPSSGYQIGRIPPGAAVKVYPDKTSGNWYWVEYNGVQGYSHSKYLTTSRPSTWTGYVTGTGGTYLAINSEPKSGTQIGRIPPGGAVTVYSGYGSGNWYWLEHGGVYGFAYSSYISSSSPSSPSDPGTSTGNRPLDNLGRVNYILQNDQTCMATAVAMTLNLIEGTNAHTTANTVLSGTVLCKNIDGNVYNGSDGARYKAVYHGDNYNGNGRLQEQHTAIENAIAAQTPIVVTVHRSDNLEWGRKHWVIVVGKDNNGNYRIVDPDDGSGGTMASHVKTMGTEKEYALGAYPNNGSSPISYGYVTFIKQ